MQKILLCISYDGTHFNGFQVQPHARTVQGVLESVLCDIYGYAIRIYPAGRTDTHVHALKQYAHFTLTQTSSIPIERLFLVMNTKLPKDVVVAYSREVPQDFHARYSATRRTYCYKMRPCTILSPMYRNILAKVSCDVDWDVFLHEAQYFCGTHDFHMFTISHHTQKNTIRTLYDISLIHKQEYVECYITANGFLWRMVRSIVGFLLHRSVLAHKKQDCTFISEFSDMLKSNTASQIRNEKHMGKCAEPQGLYLYEVQYKEEYGIPYDSYLR